MRNKNCFYFYRLLNDALCINIVIRLLNRVRMQNITENKYVHGNWKNKIWLGCKSELQVWEQTRELLEYIAWNKWWSWQLFFCLNKRLYCTRRGFFCKLVFVRTKNEWTSGSLFVFPAPLDDFSVFFAKNGAKKRVELGHPSDQPV